MKSVGATGRWFVGAKVGVANFFLGQVGVANFFLGQTIGIDETNTFHLQFFNWHENWASQV